LYRIALIDRGLIAAVGSPAELKSGIGPDATLDDVFMRLTAAKSETEAEGSYGAVRRARQAEHKHG
jgi:ABC-2 type transport system ATP-binding protein